MFGEELSKIYDMIAIHVEEFNVFSCWAQI